ncbi:MAG: Holliday junction resolvase RuvX [Polaromonas sp.]|nr:Holliday junction resolvase RuvX [Polaromonas sp.]
MALLSLPVLPVLPLLPLLQPQLRRQQTFLAFDFGLRRTGVASGNVLTRTATPQPTVLVPVNGKSEARLAAVALRIIDWQPDALVVGVPFHPDGAPHENTVRAQKFARQLRARFGLPVFEVDERYTTTEALAGGAKDADAASACIILEQFLRSLP